MRIGIMGLGIVGSAIDHVFSDYHSNGTIYRYDIDKSRGMDTIEDIASSDIVFVCVPTPLQDGTLSYVAVVDCLTRLSAVKYNGVVVIKSTLPLGAMSLLRRDIKSLSLIYSPEFLRSKTAIKDFENVKQVISSGKRKHAKVYRDALYWVDPNLFFVVDDSTAEMIKLVMNAFLATKISFVNEIESLCKEYQADVYAVFDALRREGKCAPPGSYPGLGPFEGRCLPKDTMALANSSKNTPLLRAVLEVNDRLVRETRSK